MIYAKIDFLTWSTKHTIS